MLRRWLGWDSNMQAAVALYAKLIRGAEGAGPGLVRGLATDIANYTPREKFWVCMGFSKLILICGARGGAGPRHRHRQLHAT
jgi:Glycosyl hydrolases family 6